MGVRGAGALGRVVLRVGAFWKVIQWPLWVEHDSEETLPSGEL